jgi:hypothetical protein
MTGVRFPVEAVMGFSLFATAVPRPALGSTYSIQWVPGALSPGVKRPGREADHSSPFSVEVKNAWSYASTPPYVLMVRYLVKHRDNFTFAINVNVDVVIEIIIAPSHISVLSTICLASRSM